MKMLTCHLIKQDEKWNEKVKCSTFLLFFHCGSHENDITAPHKTCVSLHKDFVSFILSLWTKYISSLLHASGQKDKIIISD